MARLRGSPYFIPGYNKHIPVDTSLRRRNPSEVLTGVARRKGTGNGRPPHRPRGRGSSHRQPHRQPQSPSQPWPQVEQEPVVEQPAMEEEEEEEEEEGVEEVEEEVEMARRSSMKRRRDPLEEDEAEGHWDDARGDKRARPRPSSLMDMDQLGFDGNDVPMPLIDPLPNPPARLDPPVSPRPLGQSLVVQTQADSQIPMNETEINLSLLLFIRQQRGQKDGSGPDPPGLPLVLGELEQHQQEEGLGDQEMTDVGWNEQDGDQEQDQGQGQGQGRVQGYGGGGIIEETSSSVRLIGLESSGEGERSGGLSIQQRARLILDYPTFGMLL